ncbi:MAG: FAD:protein FMN transferase [Pirellulaceae bacterium]
MTFYGLLCDDVIPRGHRTMHVDQPGQVTRSHPAMATTFSITLAHADELYARQAMAEAFMELERLEDRLSAYLEQSDVARIARLQGGQTCVLDPATCTCLEIALAIERETGGAFDLAYRSHPRRRASESIRLDSQCPVVQALDTAVILDLGGIGKGFALDCMAALLADWDLPCALLRASQSTLLAGEAPPGSRGWEICFGTSSDTRKLLLSRTAFSGSGTDLKGQHIIDPATGQPAKHRRLAFAQAPSGAEADALSTAFLVMSDKAIQDYCHHHPHVAAYVVSPDDQTVRTLQASPAEVSDLSCR